MAKTQITCRTAIGEDVTELVAMSREHFQHEAESVWKIDEQNFAHLLTVDIVNQFFNPTSCLVAVFQIEGKTVGYVWAGRGETTVWSREEMTVIKIAHVDMTLSARDRIRIVELMMELWEQWTVSCAISIVCSSTMRGDQTAFLRLHQRRGYDCRGSICYKRLSTDQATPAHSLNPD